MHASWHLCLGSPPESCPFSRGELFPVRPREGSKETGGGRSKRALEDEEGSMEGLSKNKLKKQLRNPHKTFDPSLKRECYPCCRQHSLRHLYWGWSPVLSSLMLDPETCLGTSLLAILCPDQTVRH